MYIRQGKMGFPAVKTEQENWIVYEDKKKK